VFPGALFQQEICVDADRPVTNQLASVAEGLGNCSACPKGQLDGQAPLREETVFCALCTVSVVQVYTVHRTALN